MFSRNLSLMFLRTRFLQKEKCISILMLVAAIPFMALHHLLIFAEMKYRFGLYSYAAIARISLLTVSLNTKLSVAIKLMDGLTDGLDLF